MGSLVKGIGRMVGLVHDEKPPEPTIIHQAPEPSATASEIDYSSKKKKTKKNSGRNLLAIDVSDEESPSGDSSNDSGIN